MIPAIFDNSITDVVVAVHSVYETVSNPGSDLWLYDCGKQKQIWNDTMAKYKTLRPRCKTFPFNMAFLTQIWIELRKGGFELQERVRKSCNG
jgi:hypothetical protein